MTGHAANFAAGANAPAWELRLYVADQTPRSLIAVRNLRRICEAHLPGRYAIQVIDLAAAPHLAEADQIWAIPTLVRIRPEPRKAIVGDLSDPHQVASELECPAPS